jgi:hypothetical protein
MRKLLMFYYNFVGTVYYRVMPGAAAPEGTFRRRVEDAVERHITEGCAKHTPNTHRWWREPMF